MVTHACDVPRYVAIGVGILRHAVDLIADRGDLERRAFLRGYADGWRDGLRAGAERVTPA
jgi:hypothetical protein